MIQPAQIDDLKDIMALVTETIAEMQAENNQQWSESYPTKTDFAQDIAQNALYLIKKERQVAAIMCLNDEEAPEYQTVAWQSQKPALVIHRMAVSPRFRRQGLAQELFIFAENEAKKRGFDVLKTDTYHCNDKMKHLILRQGFVKRGEVYFLPELAAFYCYEKILV